MSKNVKNIVRAAVLAALICAATFIHIPLPKGYANLGDCVIIISACLLPCPLGFLAAAIGASLADILMEFALYAPATFVIKGIMALLVYLAFRKIPMKNNIIKLIIAALLSEAWMVFGYFIYETILYGAGTALTTIPGNFLQGLCNGIIACVLFIAFKNNSYLKKTFDL